MYDVDQIWDEMTLIPAGNVDEAIRLAEKFIDAGYWNSDIANSLAQKVAFGDDNASEEFARRLRLIPDMPLGFT